MARTRGEQAALVYLASTHYEAAQNPLTTAAGYGGPGDRRIAIGAFAAGELHDSYAQRNPIANRTTAILDDGDTIRAD